MLAFTVSKWIGADTVGAEEFERLRPAAERAVFAAALYYEGAVKTTLAGSRSGRIYRIGKRGRVHQASAPGEAPASLTGKLRQSITHSDPIWEGDNVWVEVGSNLAYAAILEYGGVTWNGGRILPRPYMESTFLREEENIFKVMQSMSTPRPTDQPKKSGGQKRGADGRFIKAGAE